MVPQGIFVQIWEGRIDQSQLSKYFYRIIWLSHKSDTPNWLNAVRYQVHFVYFGENSLYYSENRLKHFVH